MPVVQLTSASVSLLPCLEGRGKVEYTDAGCKGLILEVRQSGGRTYYLRYTDHRGRHRQYRIGDASAISLRDAREKAGALRGQILLGADPREERATARSVPTFADFIEHQYLPYVKSYKRSWSTDVSLLNNHLLPKLGKRHLDEITREDILRVHQGRLASGAKPGTANRVLIMLRFIFNQAMRWEVPGIKTNPTKGVPLFEENNKKERYLAVEEAQRLYKAVCRSDNAMLKFIVPPDGHPNSPTCGHLKLPLLK